MENTAERDPILEQLLREREDREWFPPVSGDLTDDVPTVEFRPVPRWRRWGRVLVAGLSAAVFVVTGARWGWFL
ncbi:hypothetical protein ACWEF6_02925 [Amycolatopsis sp. NPDC004772]